VYVTFTGLVMINGPKVGEKACFVCF